LLGGVSGSGKTWLRTNSPVLRPLRHADIADCYAEGARDWREAADAFFDKAEALLVAHKGESIVLEAFFSSNQRSR